MDVKPTPDAPPAPARRDNRLWARLVVLAVLAGVAGGVFLVWYDPGRSSRPQTPPPDGDDWAGPPNAGSGRVGAARRQMEQIAEAMRAYRDQFGDGLRWPASLDDLKFVQLLPQDFVFQGLLSGRPLPYSGDVPAGMDPARWALCSDVEPAQRTYRGSRPPFHAVVLLADGSVRVLQGDELQKIGGLVYDQNIPR